MIKKLLLSLGLLVNTISSLGQCTETATGFGNNINISSYNVNGDVSITHENNKLTFKTGSNYNTANGPDVRVYLANSQGKTNQQIINTNVENIPNIPFGLVGFSGEQEITIDVPNNVDLSEYDVVFFYCLQFNQFWDFGKIDLTSTLDCSLSLKSLEQSNYISLFPNPATDEIHIDGDISKFSEYKLIDMQGRVVKKSNTISSIIDLSNVSKGIYTLFLSSEKIYEVEKIVVK